MPYLGETLALGSAITWALAVILFKKSGETVHPHGLNVFKTVLAAALLLPILYLSGESLAKPAPLRDYAILLISGAIGIGISDTLFFMSLNRLGAGLSAIVDCLYSPSVIAMAMLFLGESLTVWQILGTAMVISAVLTGTSIKGRGEISTHRLTWGLIFGALGLILLAVSIIIVKPVLERSSLLWAMEIRLLGGVAAVLLALLFLPQRMGILQSLTHVHAWGYTLSGSLIGGFLAMLLWLGGMKWTQASVAAALNQTVNIFVFLFAWMLLREPINLHRLTGILLGVGGAFLVTFA